MYKSSLLIRTIAVGTLIAMTFSLAIAQGRQGGQGQRGQGQGTIQRGGQGQGQGMMGMMQQRGGMGGSLVQIVLRPDVQRELNITPEQRTRLEALRPGGGPGGGAGMRGQGQGQGQRGQGQGQGGDMRERMAQMQAQQDAQVREILNATQMRRAEELRVQMMGARYITTPAGQAALNLTDAQKRQVADLQTKQMEAMQTVMQRARDGQIQRDEIQSIMERNENIMNEELMKILTDDQKKKLEELKGRPFTFQRGN